MVKTLEFQSKTKEIERNAKHLGNISGENVQELLPITHCEKEFSLDGIEILYTIGDTQITGNAEMYEDERFLYAITAETIIAINKRII